MQYILNNQKFVSYLFFYQNYGNLTKNYENLTKIMEI